jgi:3-methylcrotonyl-CoA carboxylase alpha subunit
MVSKLIVHGKDREDAIQKMHKALGDYKIVGLKNNITFLRKICEEKAFLENKYDTDFIENYRKSLFDRPFTKIIPKAEDLLHSALVQVITEKQNVVSQASKLGNFGKDNPWYTQDAFRVNFKSDRKLTFEDHDETKYVVSVTYLSDSEFEASVIEGPLKGESARFKAKLSDENHVQIESETERLNLEFFVDHENTIHTVRKDGDIVALKLEVQDFSGEDAASSADLVAAPMPGKIVKIFSKPGEKVVKGQQLLSLESMKMEYIIKAERDGVVKDVHTAETEFVQIGAKLVEFESVEA